MILIRIQAAIAVLKDLSSGNIMRPANFLLSEEEWKNLLDELGKGQFIRVLPSKETGTLFSYELCRPLSKISLLNVLEAIDESIHRNVSALETLYTPHDQMTNKTVNLKRVARAVLEDIKISEFFKKHIQPHE